MFTGSIAELIVELVAVLMLIMVFGVGYLLRKRSDLIAGMLREKCAQEGITFRIEPEKALLVTEPPSPVESGSPCVQMVPAV